MGWCHTPEQIVSMPSSLVGVILALKSTTLKSSAEKHVGSAPNKVSRRQCTGLSMVRTDEPGHSQWQMHRQYANGMCIARPRARGADIAMIPGRRPWGWPCHLGIYMDVGRAGTIGHRSRQGERPRGSHIPDARTRAGGNHAGAGHRTPGSPGPPWAIISGACA